jgi:NADH-quinone oxidoreductase subunit L
MFRLYNLTFEGKERFDHHHKHPHESPKTMTVPLMILAFLSIVGGFLGIPYALGGFFSHSPNLLENWLHPIFMQSNEVMEIAEGHSIHTIEYIMMLISIVIAVLAIITAKKFYGDEKWTQPRRLASGNKGIYKLLLNKYKLDEVYFNLIVDPLIITSRKFFWKVIDVKIIDGLVNNSAGLTIEIGNAIRRIQTGIAQNYALVMFGGIILILAYILFRI